VSRSEAGDYRPRRGPGPKALAAAGPWQRRLSLRPGRRLVFEIWGRWRDVVGKGERAAEPAPGNGPATNKGDNDESSIARGV
jgi:hypothetical protein